MAQLSRPRRGSLQYWPRKRAKKFVPSVNWGKIVEKNSSKQLQGFIAYKVGMKSAYVKDNTPDSMTKNERIAIPATILECPPMKIFSVRFYKKGVVMEEVVNPKLDKEVKRKIKVPKNSKRKIDDVKDYEDIRILVYSNVVKSGLKKKPDFFEVGLGGSLEEKLNFVKEKLDKDIRVSDVFENLQLVDVKGLTRGKGTQGPVKRFGIALRQHKSEKGLRKVGSIGPWHPARVTFRVPMAGQMGLFTRLAYNNKIISLGSISENNINPKEGFKKYGNVKTDFVILNGSVMGPSKRVLVLTQPQRETKKQSKKQYELLGLK